MIWRWSERPPRCAECDGPLRELGDEMIRGMPAVFEVTFRCDECGQITSQVRVALHAWQ